MQSTLTEPSRQTPVLGEYEVVVLGGMGTAAGVTNFCGLHANVHGDIRQVVYGVADDLLSRIARRRAV